jgi:hypothetical protein
VLAEKEKTSLEGHLKTAAVLGIVGLILAIIVQLEIAVFSTVPGWTVPTLPAILISLPGFEMFYSILVFVSVLAVYAVAVLVAKAVFLVESAFSSIRF